jgi:hypothetical protein
MAVSGYHPKPEWVAANNSEAENIQYEAEREEMIRRYR